MKKVMAGMLGVLILGAASGLWAVGEKGTILFEYWDGLAGDGGGVELLVGDSRWPASPSAEEWRTRLEGATNRADSYGTRVRGYLYPPRTGDFTFWIASDDSSELWLSTGETPSAAARIAYVNGYTAWRNWTTFASQKSVARRLEAGRRYYIEVRHVDGQGDDSLSVGWSGPGVTGSAATRPVVIDGKYLSAYIRDKDRLASDPRPADQSDDLRPDTPVLRWTAGYGAAAHEVFLGASLDRLGLVTRQVPTTCVVGSGLIPGQRYFWRVDEVEADGKTIHTGRPWSFTVWPNTASRPSPSDGQTGVLVGTPLSWRAGLAGAAHYVYAGTDEAAVKEATEASPEFRMVTFGSETTYAPDLPLAEGVTLYWRVDESDVAGSTVYKGNVWSFTTFAPEPEEGLVGRWTFDEGEGTRVPDYSGQGNHGQLVNGPVRISGALAGAIDLNGTAQYVLIPHSAALDVRNLTLASWICPRALADWSGIIVAGVSSSPYSLQIWGDGAIRFSANSGSVAGGAGSGSWNSTAGVLRLGQWQHLAVTYDGSTITFYHNGLKISQVSQTLRIGTCGEPLVLGADLPGGAEFFNGGLDDVRVYDRALLPDEVLGAMRGDPHLAMSPLPADQGQADVELARLVWTAGRDAVAHDVYLGQDAEAVAGAGPADVTGLYLGRQAAAQCDLTAGSLGVDRTYAWRVDEVASDGTVVKGKVWTFTIGDYLGVDDFEAYSANKDKGEAVYQTWSDGYGGNGTGSTAGDLTTPYVTFFPRFDGVKALPFLYNNSGGMRDLNGGSVGVYYSEISRTWDSAQDWTRKGTRALGLQFYGDGTNTVAGWDGLYAAIGDESGNLAVVRYGGPVYSLRQAGWHAWNIDLRSFAGVDLSRVRTLILGVGDRDRPKAQAGGKGRLVIDAIRLYGPRCVPGLSKPAGDLNGDCIVDWQDLSTLANTWLAAGQYVQPKDPGLAAGLWRLDGTALEDYSGVQGTVSGPVAAPGVDGQAMVFSEDADYIDLGPKAGEIMSTLTSFTMSIWANPDMGGGIWQRLFDLGNSDADYVMVSLCRGSLTGSGPRYGIRVDGGTEQRADSAVRLGGGEWSHVVATLDSSTATMTLYINGQVAAQNTNVTFRPRDMGVTRTNYLGKSHYSVDAAYKGLLDDFRLYRRALTVQEVLWLGKAAASYRFEGNAGRCDLNADGVVDAKDFAVLASSWRTLQTWP